jgi:hypothetical protein
MSNIDDIRKVLQDFLAPELASLKEKIEAIHKISDARFEAQQSQYAAVQTNMEVIKQLVKNSNDVISGKLDALMKEKV